MIKYRHIEEREIVETKRKKSRREPHTIYESLYLEIVIKIKLIQQENRHTLGGCQYCDSPNGRGKKQSKDKQDSDNEGDMENK